MFKGNKPKENTKKLTNQPSFEEGTSEELEWRDGEPLYQGRMDNCGSSM